MMIAALVAAATYALALNRRSWPLWLVAFGLTIATLWIAYFFREPGDPTPRVARHATWTAGVSRSRHHDARTATAWRDHARTLPYAMNEDNVPVDRFRVSA